MFSLIQSQRWHLQVVDLTGDGVPDVAVSATKHDSGGVTDRGAVLVWSGGAGLSGTPAPIVLVDPAAAANGLLEARWFEDVTGDGVVDVVTASFNATVGGVAGVGRALVWSGGPGLLAVPGPTATLEAPGHSNSLLLGSEPLATAYADFDEDGARDIVLATPYATVGGQTNAGAVFVWRGGASLSGTVAPIATLTSPAPSQSDFLGRVDHPQTPLLTADVTGDGRVDLVVVNHRARVSGQPSAGRVYVWSGATLNGPPAPIAELRSQNPQASEYLGGDNATYGGSGVLHLVDLSGDGTLDVVASTRRGSPGGVSEAGFVLEWAGGVGLGGVPAPRATWTIPGAQPQDWLGFLRYP